MGKAVLLPPRLRIRDWANFSAGALGGLAGLLVANKSARKLLTKYGTNALLVGGGAVAGTVLWNKYKDKIRAAHQDEPQFGAQSTPLDERGGTFDPCAGLCR